MTIEVTHDIDLYCQNCGLELMHSKIELSLEKSRDQVPYAQIAVFACEECYILNEEG